MTAAEHIAALKHLCPSKVDVIEEFAGSVNADDAMGDPPQQPQPQPKSGTALMQSLESRLKAANEKLNLHMYKVHEQMKTLDDLNALTKDYQTEAHDLSVALDTEILAAAARVAEIPDNFRAAHTPCPASNGEKVNEILADLKRAMSSISEYDEVPSAFAQSIAAVMVKHQPPPPPPPPCPFPETPLSSGFYHHMGRTQGHSPSGEWRPKTRGRNAVSQDSTPTRRSSEPPSGRSNRGRRRSRSPFRDPPPPCAQPPGRR